MATACFEKKVIIQGASHGLGGHSYRTHHHHHHHFHSHAHHHHHHCGNINLTLDMNNNGDSSLSKIRVLPSNHSTTSTATVVLNGQIFLLPSAGNKILISDGSPFKAEASTYSNFKDFEQPLHVDCSVEYELPSQAKPPPGGGDPLLMIHPCFYRRAEQERQSSFVNNLPRIVPVSSSRENSRRKIMTMINRSLNASRSIMTGCDAASSSIILRSATGAIVVDNHPTNKNGNLVQDALNTLSRSPTAINTLLHCHRRSVSRRIGDDAIGISSLNPGNDGKNLRKQHISGLLFSTLPTTADENAVISGIYQHYFRSIRSHHDYEIHTDFDHHSQPSQIEQLSQRRFYDNSHSHVKSGVTFATARSAEIFLQNFQVPVELLSSSTRLREPSQCHPYRRPSRAIADVPTISSFPSDVSFSGVYATSMNDHRNLSQKAHKATAAAITAAAIANTSSITGNFYEGPVYEALPSRS